MGNALALELIQEAGGQVWAAEASDWDKGGPEPLKIGISLDAIQQRARRGLRHMVGQLYGVLGPGLILAEYVFQGLKRDMLVRGDSHADINKLAITWTASRDARFVGDPFNGGLEYLSAPANRVFVVYVSPNEMLEAFPSVFGWAEHWTWLPADPSVRGAPINHDTRFDRRLWIKPGLK